LLHGIPLITSASERPAYRRRVGGYGRVAEWVALNPLRCPDLRWTKVEERIQVDLIVVDAEVAANNQVSFAVHLVGKSNARSKVVLTRVVEIHAVLALYFEPCAYHIVGNLGVALGALHGPEVLVA
jgi:hypothetical protein